MTPKLAGTEDHSEHLLTPVYTLSTYKGTIFDSR